MLGNLVGTMCMLRRLGGSLQSCGPPSTAQVRTCMRTPPTSFPLCFPQCSGSDIDSEHARRLGGEVLEAVLRTQLGCFFAANLVASFSTGITLATKALFLGQLSPSETSTLSEVGARRLSGGLASRALAGGLGMCVCAAVPTGQCPALQLSVGATWVLLSESAGRF